MRRDDVLAILKSHESEIRALGVRSLSLFGSVSRDEARPGSDVDLLVEFDRPIGLFGFQEVQERISSWLGCEVDLVPRDALKPFLRARVLSEAIRAA
ncbi:nucleotidyltransferase family protein [Myxococcota bacterium]|nr:nucleotidyltransferase family protein [Myxococcota bacterium]